MSKIIVIGRASKKRWEISLSKQDLEKNLLTFLQENKFPIASSCSGKAQCLKCITSQKDLSCEKKVKDFIDSSVSFDYL